MCTGCSPASWRMYSPRSVSTGRTPAASSASLRPISSVAIDFDFAASFAPAFRQTSTMYALASAAVAATNVLPPRDSTASRKRADVRIEVVDHSHSRLVRTVAEVLGPAERVPGMQPFVHEPARREIERCADALIGELQPRDLPEGAALGPRDAAHASIPLASAVARWTTRTPRRSCSARPRRCMRQPGSAVTSASASAAPASFSSAIASETSG